MDYKKIVYNVAQSLDPDLTINVTLASVEDFEDAHFVVAVIDYPTRIMTVPFIIYNDGEIYIPYDWEAVLPISSDNVYTTTCVQFHL